MAKKSGGMIWILIIAVFVLCAFTYSQFNKPTYDIPDVERPFLGNLDAKVVVTEFSDLQCPACRAAHPVAKRIITEYGDQIKFEFKHMPLSSIHPYAQKAAEGAECANDQGKFWEYIDAAFIMNPLTTSNLKKIGKDLGLDTVSFNACIDSGARGDIVDSNFAEGITLGIPGTPAFFVNGKQISSWQYEVFKAAVDEALASS